MLQLHLTTAWVAILTGFLSGAAIGIFFHKPAFLGGYGAWPRRLLRLAHIACFGMAFINLAFVVTLATNESIPHSNLASTALLIGTIGMPLTCALAAWKKPLRNLFPIPVIALLTASAIACWGAMQGAT